jgi:Zinc-finger of C2H2 type
MFKCEICSKSYKFSRSLSRHERSHKSFEKTGFLSEKAYKDHLKECADKLEMEKIYCELCDKYCIRKNFSSHLQSSDHIRKSLLLIDANCSMYQTALKGNFVIYRVHRTENNAVEIDVKAFLNTFKKCIKTVFERKRKLKKKFKVKFSLIGLFTFSCFMN